jgi:hypothetical protein
MTNSKIKKNRGWNKKKIKKQGSNPKEKKN